MSIIHMGRLTDGPQTGSIGMTIFARNDSSSYGSMIRFSDGQFPTYCSFSSGVWGEWNTFSPVKVSTFSKSLTIGATASAYVDIPFTISSGYSFLVATPADTGNLGIVWRALNKNSDNSIRCYMDNWSNASKTGTITIRVISVRSAI